VRGVGSDAVLLPLDGSGHPGRACPSARRGVPGATKLLLVGLLAALIAVTASPARAAIHPPTTRRASARQIPGSCPGAELQPTEEDLAGVRAATVCLVNRERAVWGERPLSANGRLEQAAQSHADSMSLGDYFAHVGPGGETPVDRMRAAGYISNSHPGYEVGENIGWGTLSQATPSAIVVAWMASPGHRANILDARFRFSAVGVCPHPPPSLAGGQAGAIYTQDFGDE
jgi:uncharacterized protein YkwD